MSSDSELDPLAEPRGLIEALLEDRLSPEGGRQLERLVCERKDVRQLYLRYMHLNCSLPPHFAPLYSPLYPLPGTTDSGDPPGGEDSGLGKVLHANPRDEMPAAPAPRSARARWLTSRRRIGPVVAAIAACVILGLFFYRGRSVARVTAAAAEWDQPDPAGPGDSLRSGRELRLRSGTVDIAFDSGAQVTVQGPASFRVVDRNRGDLADGRLTAYVPPQARGFSVMSSDLVVTDLGTKFEMIVSRAGVAEVRTLEGIIQVGWQGKAASAGRPPTRLTMGQTLACRVTGGDLRARLATTAAPPVTSPVPTATAPARRAIPLHNTGAGMAEGNSDPYWQVAAVSHDKAFFPRPAVVTKPAPGGRYLPNDPAASQWLSLGATLPRLSPGTYTFKTLVDLTGYDHRTVTVSARISADDAVEDVRLNGKSTGLTVPFEPKSTTRFATLTFPGGFAPGVNEVEFIVLNKPDTGGEGNPMALRVEWDGTGLPRAAN